MKRMLVLVLLSTIAVYPACAHQYNMRVKSVGVGASPKLTLQEVDSNTVIDLITDSATRDISSSGGGIVIGATIPCCVVQIDIKPWFLW